MRLSTLTAWAAILCAATAGAQTPSRKDSAQYAGTERASRVEAPPPGIRLGLRKAREFALATLSDSERAALARRGPRLPMGVDRALPAGAMAAGAWETAADGTRLWRMAIRSPGSTGVRVEFRNFAVGNGKVWLYDGTHTAGPYTGTGIFDDGHFWSATIFSESVTVEYAPAPEMPAETLPPFEIRRVAHQVRTALSAAAAPLPVPDAGTPDPADYCHLDPNCYPDWIPAMSMVGQISFEDTGVEYLCSGSLVSTRDNSFKLYFLTAGHCINSEDAARSMETYWTYQTSSCGGTPPASRDSSAKSTVGAHLVDWGTIAQGDYSLVLLQDVPKGVTFAGWDITDPPLGTAVAGIHHPAGSWKRISFGERTADEDVVVEGSAAPGSEYLSILWDKGRTEPGSSGSPLFTSPGVIVGTLTYGPVSPDLTACQINSMVVGYARFSNTYQNLKPYLENLPSAQVLPDHAALSFTVTNRTASGAQTVHLSTQSSGQIAYKLRADAPWMQLSTSTGQVSAGSPAAVTVAIDPSQFNRSQQYTSTVTILSGSAAPQYINVTVNVSAPQSNVVETIAPNPVYLSAGQWNFTVQLAETAGVATKITAMKIDGTDYTSSLAGWFGTAAIPANGTIQAPIQAPASTPKGLQFFEFWGIDASGQTWYRVATVTLM